MLWLYRWEEYCRQLTILPEKVLISFFYRTYYRGKGVIFGHLWIRSTSTVSFRTLAKNLWLEWQCSFNSIAVFCVWCVWRHPVSYASQFVRLEWRKEEEDRLTLKGPPKIICHKSKKKKRKEKQSGSPFDTQMLSLGDKALPFDWRNKYGKAK